MSDLKKNNNKIEENNTSSIKVHNLVNFITLKGETVPSVLVEKQFGIVKAKGCIPIIEFYYNPLYVNLIGLPEYDTVSKQDIYNQLEKLCLNKDVLTVIDNFGYCDLNGAKVFVHAGGVITNSFSPALPLTSSYRNKSCNLMSLSTEDNPRELVSSFLQILKVSDSKPEIGSVLMALITREALLHFEPSCVSVFFVNNLLPHTPTLSRLNAIAYSGYLTYHDRLYSVKQSENTNTKESQEVYIEVNKKNIDLNVISKDYMEGSGECFSKVMKLFIQYIINNYDKINYHVSSKSIDDDRSYPSKVVADLMLGIDIFLGFCISEKYLSNQEAKVIYDSQYEIINSLIKKYFAFLDSGSTYEYDITNMDIIERRNQIINNKTEA